jgi:hypothetical protein
MGQKEGGERAGHRLHHDRLGGCHDRGKAGIHLRVRVVDGERKLCVRRSSMPDTSLPHASPYRLSHHHMLAFSLSAVSLRPRQKGRRAGIMRLSHSRRRTAERSCPTRDTREMEASMVTSVSLCEQQTGWS